MTNLNGSKKQLTYPMFQLASKLLIGLISASVFVSCASTPEPIVHGPVERIFLADYDLVWKAAHTVLKYPLANENQESGVMETEFIKAIDGWQPPEVLRQSSSGQRYKIVIKMVRGKAGKNESVKVALEKKLEVQRDFFADSEDLKSDGLEEKSLLYRIDREILLEKAIAKALKTSN